MNAFETYVKGVSGGSGGPLGNGLIYLFPCSDTAGATSTTDIISGLTGYYGTSGATTVSQIAPTGDYGIQAVAESNSAFTVTPGAAINSGSYTLFGLMNYQGTYNKPGSGGPTVFYVIVKTHLAQVVAYPSTYAPYCDVVAVDSGGTTHDQGSVPGTNTVVDTANWNLYVLTASQSGGVSLYTKFGMGDNSFPGGLINNPGSLKTETTATITYGGFVFTGNGTASTPVELKDLGGFNYAMTASQVKGLFNASGTTLFPSAPTATIATAGGTDTITISTAVTPGTFAIAGYQLSAGATSGSETFNANTTNTMAPITFSILSPTFASGASAYYTVAAFDEFGNFGPASNEVQSAVNPVTPTPNAAGVSSSSGGSATSVATSTGNATLTGSQVATSTALHRRIGSQVSNSTSNNRLAGANA